MAAIAQRRMNHLCESKTVSETGRAGRSICLVALCVWVKEMAAMNVVVDCCEEYDRFNAHASPARLPGRLAIRSPRSEARW